MARKLKRRRGVVILVVLSLLVLFTLLVVTYAIVSGQYRRAAEAFARQELLGVQPQKDLDRAFYQVLRDTQQSGSAARFHSLLRDLYGEDGFSGTLTNAVALPATGDQLLDLVTDVTVDMFPESAVIQPFMGAERQPYTAADLSRITGFYNGCVLTITSGEASGLSTRIVGYEKQNDLVPVFRVVAFRSDAGSSIQPSQLMGASFVVNGRPFNGTGIGYSGGAMTDIALRPNYSFNVPANDGGADESYDAVDYQNMFLALNPPRMWHPGPDGRWGNANQDDNNDGVIDNYAEAGWPGSDDWQYPVIPSFHRPELINYWMAQTDASGTPYWDDPNFRRQVCLRPIEPNFDGSNPSYHPVNGPWDVDNDGDGVPDSIWIDLGFPAQTAADGRKYKPLFAILCTDMDGRWNINAHGRLAAVSPSQPSPVPVFGGTTASLNLPRGQGYGPPEISLRWLFSQNSLANLLDSRYGGNGPGAPGVDAMAVVRFFDHPANYFSGNGRVFRSPPDLQGELRMGLNASGQPVFEQYALGIADSPYEFDMTNDRPGFDSLTASRTLDAPFTAAELEGVLRRHDVDAALLPSRLDDVTGIQRASEDTDGDGIPDVFFLRDLNGDTQVDRVDASIARLLVTTDSYDLPVPSVLNAGTPGDRILNISQLLDSRLRTNLPPAIQSQSPDQQRIWIAQQLEVMLAKDILLGLRMDLNRLLGDGADNDGNGAIDDPAEVANDQLWGGAIHPTYAGIQFNHANKTPLALGERKLARQQLARHLYVMAMLLTDGAPATKARTLAQWAVNVVDFRDTDAIMTPFEFDPNPFDGWDVDGVVNGYQGMTSSDDDPNNIVWGCERPELLISEVLAFHERRTEDLEKEPNGKLAADEEDGKLDFDQRLRPIGSCFVELYNPWNGTDTNTTPPWELYDYIDANSNSQYDSGEVKGVRLNKLAPGGAPVWRLIVVNAKLNDGSTDNPEFSKDPDQWLAGAPEPGIDAERAIYFSNPSVLPATTKHGYRRFHSSVDPNTQKIIVPPGAYAVAASMGIRGDGVSLVGRRTGTIDSDQAVELGDPTLENLTANIPQTHRVVMDWPGNMVQVFRDSNLDFANSAVTISIDQSDLPGANIPGQKLPMSLSLSEPLDGYPYYDNANAGPGGQVWEPNGASGEGSYQDGAGGMLPLDEPLDDQLAHRSVATVDGTIRNFCYIHLQRLADPTQPWHVTGNPYRTIDSSLADLTVFNGLNPRGSEDPYGFLSNGADGVQWCLERGENEHRKNAEYQVQYGQNLPAEERKQLWRQVRFGERPTSITAGSVTDHHFPFRVTRTLGGLNYWYNPSVAGGHPFPWLAWNDRPYVSHYELLQVPFLSSSQLLKEYRQRETRGDLRKFTNSSLEYVDAVDPIATSPPSSPLPEDWPYDDANGNGVRPVFEHVGNFFDSRPGQALHIYRVLEYLRVPSRFLGTETMFNPNAFQTGAGTQGFHPPFNRIPTYREPGRININTVVHPFVWAGLFDGFSGPSYYEMDASRRGYGPIGGAPVFSPPHPTMFFNPFRAPGSRVLVPPRVASLQPTMEVDVTLLRHIQWQQRIADPDDVSNTPPQQITVTKRRPMFQSATLAGANDARRNTYFRYQNLHRLGNMLTTRSNVYAIWITVGYFEVESNNGVDVFHPDGFRVGQELGLDTGQVRRHRAFYMVDRTIPVAFQPGQNHNVDRCVLLRRYIE
jgi:hypothetical protein